MMKRYTLSEIEARANGLIQQYVDMVGKDWLIENGLNFDDLYEKIILPQFGIEVLETDAFPILFPRAEVLGAYVPSGRVAFINARIGKESGDPRRVWTLYHEVCGHGVLQGEWLNEILSARGQSGILETSSTIDMRTRHALERQANAMAAATSAPQWLLGLIMIKRLELRRQLRYIGPRTYMFGPADVSVRVRSFEHYAYEIARIVAPAFHGLSIQSLGYRVQKSPLVTCAYDDRAVHRLAT